MDLLSNSEASHRALDEFCDCCDRLHAEGVVFVDYRRAAYVSKSAESVRVTFDRNVVGRPYYSGCGLKSPVEASAAVARGVVLELKYNGRAPRWMHDVVTTLSLQRLSFPKYVACVDALRIDPEHAAPGLRRGGKGISELFARSARP
jgi:hypothetical protein